MPKTGRYDISGADYWERMNRLTEKYRALRTKADRVRHENKGQPSEEEGRLWGDAAKCCDEILSVGMGERNVREQWEERGRDCRARLKEIVETLHPPKPKAEKEPAAAAAPARPSGGAGERSYVTTPSGFKTRNAVSDVVSAEMIEGWYQKRDPKRSLESVIGMQELKDRLQREVASIGWSLTDQAMGISPVQTYFFYGPPGTGKTFLIDSFANEMMDQGFKYIKIVGSEIHSSFVGEAEKIVTAAFREAIDAAPCILFIDEVDGVCANRNGPDVRSHEKKLTNAFLEARNEMYKSDARVVFFGGTNLPWEVDAAMLDAAKLMRIPLPDEEARRGYFARELKKFTLEEGFTLDEMVEATDNCSFRELSTKLMPSVLNSIKDELTHIEANWVLDENGKLDRIATDKKVAELVKSGTVVLRREIFERERKALGLPSDKTEVREKLLAFEKGAEA